MTLSLCLATCEILYHLTATPGNQLTTHEQSTQLIVYHMYVISKALFLGAHCLLSYFSSSSFPLQLFLMIINFTLLNSTIQYNNTINNTILSLASTNSLYICQDAMVSLSVYILNSFTPWFAQVLKEVSSSPSVV